MTDAAGADYDLPPRINKIGAREIDDHFHLPPAASCLFWGEYTPFSRTNGRGFSYSKTNQLITNLKKKPSRRGFPDWQYKLLAIEGVAKHFARAIDWQETLVARRAMLVPMPPSKPPADPEYDPRMLQIVNRIGAHIAQTLDVRDCLRFDGSCSASHESEDRPTPDRLVQALTFDPAVGRPGDQPGLIIVVDDMLTTGAHFVAAQRVLSAHFPGVTVAGLFVARRVAPPSSPDEWAFE